MRTLIIMLLYCLPTGLLAEATNDTDSSNLQYMADNDAMWDYLESLDPIVYGALRLRHDSPAIGSASLDEQQRDARFEQYAERYRRTIDRLVSAPTVSAASLFHAAMVCVDTLRGYCRQSGFLQRMVNTDPDNVLVYLIALAPDQSTPRQILDNEENRNLLEQATAATRVDDYYHQGYPDLVRGLQSYFTETAPPADLTTPVLQGQPEDSPVRWVSEQPAKLQAFNLLMPPLYAGAGHPPWQIAFCRDDLDEGRWQEPCKAILSVVRQSQNLLAAAVANQLLVYNLLLENPESQQTASMTLEFEKTTQAIACYAGVVLPSFQPGTSPASSSDLTRFGALASEEAFDILQENLQRHGELGGWRETAQWISAQNPDENARNCESPA